MSQLQSEQKPAISNKQQFYFEKVTPLYFFLHSSLKSWNQFKTADVFQTSNQTSSKGLLSQDFH